MEKFIQYATIIITEGYQKDTSSSHQRTASLYAVLFTQCLKDLNTEDQPSAVFDSKTFRRMIYEKKIIN